MGILIEDQITPLTEAQATFYLKEGWRLKFNEYPNPPSLALLWAQSALESGRWQKYHCYNWGNIKFSGGDDEMYCMYRCNEVLKGKLQWFDPPHPQTWFRAYQSPLAGSVDYIGFLHDRKSYQAAWKAIELGDPAQYSHALKLARYYTADEAKYTAGVVSLTNEFKRHYDSLNQWHPETNPNEPLNQEEKEQLHGLIALHLQNLANDLDFSLSYT